MHCKKLFTRSFVLLIFILENGASTTQDDTEMATGNMAKKFEASIEAYDEDQKAGSLLQFTAISLTKTDTTIKDFYDLIRTLYIIPADERALTVLTIKRRNEDEKDDTSTNMASFIAGIQQYIANKEEKSICIGNLVLTIERMKEDQMPDFDTISTTCSKIKGIYSNLSNNLIDNFKVMLSSAFVSFFENCVANFIRDFFEKDGKMDDSAKAVPTNDNTTKETSYKMLSCYDLGLFDNWMGTDEELEQKRNKIKVDLTQYVDEHSSGIIDALKRSFEFVNERQSDVCEFRRCKYLRQKVIEGTRKYQTAQNFKYLPYEEDFQRATSLLSDKLHMETLEGLFINAVRIGFELVAKSENKENLKKTFLKGYDKLIENDFINYQFNDESNPRYYGDYGGVYKGIYDEDKRTAKDLYRYVFDAYIEAIGFDQSLQKMLQIYQSQLNRGRQELTEHNSTKMMFTGEMTTGNLHALCEILYKANVFERLDENQIIYVDINKLLSDEVLKSGVDKYAEGVLQLVSGTRYVVSKDEKLTVYTSNKGTDPNTKCDGTKVTFYKNLNFRCEDAVCATFFGILAEDKKDLEPYKRNNSDKCIEKCHYDSFKQCLEKNGSEFVYLHKISATNNHIASDVYIMCHTRKDSKSNMMSVICDVQDKDKFAVADTTREDPRKIKCFDNMPLPLLKRFIACLQASAHTNTLPFEIPNTWYFGNMQCVYLESLNMSSRETHEPGYIYKRIEKFYKSKEKKCKVISITMVNLLDLMNNLPKDNTELDDLCQVLGMTLSVFKAFVCKFILHINPPKDELEYPYTSSEYGMKESIILYAVKVDDNTYVLHMSIEKDFDTIDSIFSSPTKVLANLFENEQAKPLLDVLSSIERTKKCKVKMATIIVNELCKLRYFDPAAGKSNFDSKTFSKKIMDIIESLFPQYTEDDRPRIANRIYSPQKLSYIVFKLRIKPLIEKLRKMVFAEEKKLPRKKTVKFFSFQITHNKITNESAENGSIMQNAEYENLEFLDVEEEKE